MKRFNAGYAHGNYYLIDAGRHCLAIDVGWPGTIRDYGRSLRPTGRKVHEIEYLVVTHFHPDHAGLVRELQDLGTTFVILDAQVESVAPMEALIRRKMSYRPINIGAATVITESASGEFLRGIGIAGRVVHTPGHSGDSISVLLDSGDAFTGDLRPEHQVMDDNSAAKTSWLKLQALGARRISPGHGPPFDLRQETDS